MASTAAPRNRGGKSKQRKFCQRSEIPHPDPSNLPKEVDAGTVEKLFESTKEPCTIYAKTKVQIFKVPWCEGTWRLCGSCQTVFVMAAAVMQCSTPVTLLEKQLRRTLW